VSRLFTVLWKMFSRPCTLFFFFCLQVLQLYLFIYSYFRSWRLIDSACWGYKCATMRFLHCVCRQLFRAFISKCDFFDEGKVMMPYYVSDILDSHVSESVQGDLYTCMFNLLSDKFSGFTTFSTIYLIIKINFTWTKCSNTASLLLRVVTTEAKCS